jgi:hypothetical protein
MRTTPGPACWIGINSRHEKLACRAGLWTRLGIFGTPPLLHQSRLRTDPGSDAGGLTWGYGIEMQDRVQHLNINIGFLRHRRTAQMHCVQLAPQAFCQPLEIEQLAIGARCERLREEYWSALYGLGTSIPVTALDVESARLLQ